MTSVNVKYLGDGRYGLMLNDFKDFIDVKKVYYYKIKARKDKSLLFSFYDQEGNIIKPSKRKPRQGKKRK